MGAGLRTLREYRRSWLASDLMTAVDGYVASTGTAWVDWEERPIPTPEAPTT